MARIADKRELQIGCVVRKMRVVEKGDRQALPNANLVLAEEGSV
jgi:hypothetical protein